jgi:cytoskeletal protein RodZ
MNDFGALLRQARDFKGVTLREAERATRISRTYLSALEAEEFSQMPPSAYARGIVRNYAQYLGLDPASTLDMYEQASGSAPSSVAVVPATRPLDGGSHWAPNFAIIAFMVVMSAVVFAWMYSAYFQRPDVQATTTSAGMPTVTPVPDSILALAADQATVATQGGGVATLTPSPTPTQEASATATTAPEEVVDEPTDDAEVEVDGADQQTEPVGSGAHTFVLYTLEDVWVQVALDGVVVHDDVIPAGAERIFYGDSAAITSGNSALVDLWVDGENYGALGDSWDATFYYP